MAEKLSTLINDVQVVRLQGDPHLTISHLTCDSRHVQPGSLFFAIPGLQADGARFAREAVAKGAVAVVTESDALELAEATVIRVAFVREAMADIAARFYGYPARNLKVAGITGTNGKTTTAFLLKHILDSVLMPSGLIGTVRYVVGGEEVAASRTTPESLETELLLARMCDAGDRAATMEVSSHALKQNRVRGIDFDVAIFTNLTQDHLDYHPTMDDYFEAKALLFEQVRLGKNKKGKALVNADDRYGHRLIERMRQLGGTVLTYGQGIGVDYRASDIKSDALGTRFQLEAKGKNYLVRLPLIGVFNVYNAVAALATAQLLGVEMRAAVQALQHAPQVPGRLQRVPAKRSFQVFVDYAHTDDALRNVLKTLRELKPSRLLVVFGCGGNRDTRKRPLMARAAEELADGIIITSDNPRMEDPEKILDQVEAGISRRPYLRITDRARAIHEAVAMARSGDIVLIAGKGHENYQEVGSEKFPFDDVAVARKAIEARPVELF